MLSPTAQKVLLRATELIGIKHRWIKKAWHGITRNPVSNKIEESYCALGVVEDAAAEVLGTHMISDVCGEVVRALNKHLPPWATSITHFNDTKATTHADVKAMFCNTVKEEVKDE